MASSESTVLAVVERLRTEQPVRWLKMFGEYAIYCNEKVVALVCDDRLFVKPTESGRAHIGEPTLAPPYPGARDSFLIEEPRLSDDRWLSELIAVTERELPAPKPRKPRARKATGRG